MKVKSIIIEFEPENDYEQTRATILKMENGGWSADKPMISSYMAMCHELWKVIRTFNSRKEVLIEK